MFLLFATIVVDTCGKFIAGVVDTGGNLPLVSTTPEVPVAKFTAGVVDTGGIVPLIVEEQILRSLRLRSIDS